MRFKKKKNKTVLCGFIFFEKSPVETGLFYYLKCCMRKIKIFITVLLIYEFAMLTILQIPHYCMGIFSGHFCSVSFRYFFVCIVVPGLFGVFLWWVPEISRFFCKRCQCEIPYEKTVSNKVSEITSKQIIEHLITTALIAGIDKFASNHPKTKKKIQDIAKVISDKK